ncbi:hypothetical protein [Streptomyces sp. NPDC003006]
MKHILDAVLAESTTERDRPAPPLPDAYCSLTLRRDAVGRFEGAPVRAWLGLFRTAHTSGTPVTPDACDTPARRTA